MILDLPRMIIDTSKITHVVTHGYDDNCTIYFISGSELTLDSKDMKLSELSKIMKKDLDI